MLSCYNATRTIFLKNYIAVSLNLHLVIAKSHRSVPVNKRS